MRLTVPHGMNESALVVGVDTTSLRLYATSDETVLVCGRRGDMATFELYRRSTIGICLTETLDEMVSSGTLSPELTIQVLVQFDKVLYPLCCHILSSVTVQLAFPFRVGT